MKLAALVLMMVLPGAAGAGCNHDLATVTGWSITPIDEDTNRLVTELRWSGAEAVRMVDGSVQFRDVLGGNIAGFALTRDQMLSPGGAFVESGRWGRYSFERLLGMNRADVVVRVCIRGIVTAGGQVETY